MLHVAGGENAVDVGHPVAVVPDVAAVGDLDTQLFEHAGLLGTGEAHRQQGQFTGDPEVAVGDFVENDPARFALHLHLDHVQFPEVAVLVADELVGGYGVQAFAALFVGRGGAEDERPFRPGIGG